jgi:hypothetical protein
MEFLGFAIVIIFLWGIASKLEGIGEQLEDIIALEQPTVIKTIIREP